MRHVDPDARPDATANGGAHAGPYDERADDPALDALAEFDAYLRPPADDEPRPFPFDVFDPDTHEYLGTVTYDGRNPFVDARRRNRERFGDDAAEGRYRP